MGGVSVAVAQAMRCAGCPNRRSLGVSDVFPPGFSFRAGLGPYLAPQGGARKEEEREDSQAWLAVCLVFKSHFQC